MGSHDADWTCPFPPERECRSYMMDMVESDVAEMPSGAVADWTRHAADPLALVPAEAWEPYIREDGPPPVGLVLPHMLQVTGPLNPGGRTPCREGHYILVHIDSTADQSPCVGCPIFTWTEHTRHREELQTDEALRTARLGRMRGYLPVLLPREGHDAEPNVFIQLTARAAFTYRTVRRCAPVRLGTLRLKEAYVNGLLSAFARHRDPE